MSGKTFQLSRYKQGISRKERLFRLVKSHIERREDKIVYSHGDRTYLSVIIPHLYCMGAVTPDSIKREFPGNGTESVSTPVQSLKNIPLRILELQRNRPGRRNLHFSV